MKYLQIHDNKPLPPPHLVASIDEVLQMENCFPASEWAHVYASFKPPQQLVEWAEDVFDNVVLVRYQLIQQNLEPHIDIGDEPWKYNLILTTGGDVTTRWWDGDVVMETAKLEPLMWYSLNVHQTHDIIGLTSPRLSIVVRCRSTPDRPE